MPIIVSHKGKDAKRYDSKSFTDETELQEYITDNPEAISSLTDVDPSEQRVFVAAREFSTGSGPVDAIGFSQAGTIYIIETKLYRNSDKRLVLAQVLDYGASLWKRGGTAEEFIQDISGACLARHEKSFEDMASDFFELDPEGAESFLAAVTDNFENSRFKFVILMDKVESRLKDLIFFINTNSKFDVYGVELEYYKVEENEILIPRIWGEEVRKEVGTSASSSARKKWDKESFFEELQKSAPDAYENIRKLYEYVEKEGLKIDFGTGAVNGSFTPKVASANERDLSLFHASTTGEIEVLSWYWGKYNESLKSKKDYLKEMSNEIETIPSNAAQNEIYKYDISKFSEKDLENLIKVYTNIIGWARKTEMTDNPDYK